MTQKRFERTTDGECFVCSHAGLDVSAQWYDSEHEQRLCDACAREAGLKKYRVTHDNSDFYACEAYGQDKHPEFDTYEEAEAWIKEADAWNERESEDGYVFDPEYNIEEVLQ